MKLPVAPVLFCLALSAGPVAAQVGSVQAEPAEPVFREGFTVKIAGSAPVTPRVRESSVSSGVVRIDLSFGACGVCFDVPYEIEVPFPRSLVGDDPEPGEYVIEVRDGAGPLLASGALRIIGVERGTRVQATVVTPFRPTDNDPLELNLIYAGNTCDFSNPRFAPVGRAGDTLVVDFSYNQFGPVSNLEPREQLGEDAGLAGKCTPPVPFVSVVEQELGQLEEGQYRLLVYLNETLQGVPTRKLVHFRQLRVEDGQDRLALQDGRFLAEVRWRLPDGREGVGSPVAGASNDTGLFSFFERENWELMVKVLDGCDANGHFWVLGSGSTDVEFELTIVDTESQDVFTHTNPQGELARAFGSTTAFPGCEP